MTKNAAHASLSSGLFLILILILYITAPFVRLLGKEINRVGEDRVIKDENKRAYILKGLSAAELETLELLLDEDAYEGMNQSLKELGEGKGIPIDEW